MIEQTEAISTERALELALEALESLVFNKPFDHRYGDVLAALREALASEAIEQPAQNEQAPPNYQAKWLGDALFECIKASGIIRKDIPGLSVAELLFFSQDLKAMLTEQTAPVAKPHKQEPVVNPFEDKSVISALSWAAGLIEQAYRECGGHNGADSWLMNYADKQGERIRQADPREWEKVNGRWQVKATAAIAQRQARSADTWVGLTNEEKLKAVKKFRDTPVALVFDIEAKLKEKNSD